MTGADRGEHPGSDDARRPRLTINEEVRRDSLGYIETFQRNEAPRVTVFDGPHELGKGTVLVEVTGELGEHPADLARRALAEGRLERDRRLRARVAELEQRRDYLQGQLDIIHDAEYSRNDTLKRRIEKLEGAGDALVGHLEVFGPWDNPKGVGGLIDAWREAVRGDAPTDVPIAGAFSAGTGGQRVTITSCSCHPDAPAAAPADGQAPADDTAAPDDVLGRVRAEADELAAAAGALISHTAATGSVPSRASGLWARLERAAKSWRSQR